jgi:K+-transporting ATPase ATPase C chain
MKQAFRAMVLATLVFGLLYPLSVGVLGSLLFPQPTVKDWSELMSQNFQKPIYFWGRPRKSSNAGVADPQTHQKIKDARIFWQKAHGLSEVDVIPPELLMPSASGLDPHISREAALLQMKRVAVARKISDPSVLEGLIDDVIEPPQLRVMGRERVNVLKLNRLLDERFPLKPL